MSESTTIHASSSHLPSQAPARPLPSTVFYSIEYPGYVQPSSVPLAVRNLGGQESLDNAFKRTASKTETLVELRLRPDNPFAHPIPGDVVATNNILLKVVKKKKRMLNGHDESIGEYTVEAVGVIPKTVRFRGMADYQYQPDMNDPIAKLRVAMDNMDVETIRTYRIPDENENYTVPVDSPLSNDGARQTENQSAATRSNLRLFPPPLLSRQGISHVYNFKANPASIPTTTVDEETGEEKKRLINRMRWKGYGPASILFSDKSIPEQPPVPVEQVRGHVNQDILKRLREFFAERPIWTRMSLFNQFPPADSREIHNSKVLLPLVCYVFQDGPWRDTLVRFDYDPRKEVGARFYQRLYFRNANHPIARPSVITRRQDRTLANTQNRAVEQGRDKDADRKSSHIFDGVTIAKETAAFQLCDITDPMLKSLIEDTTDLRETCHERDGWYSAHAFEQIKTILRHKFFSLLEGHAATDEECSALLAASEGSSKLPTTRNQKLRAGRHNMAKGALRPEDAAAVRLRATLERNAKGLMQHATP